MTHDFIRKGYNNKNRLRILLVLNSIFIIHFVHVLTCQTEKRIIHIIRKYRENKKAISNYPLKDGTLNYPKVKNYRKQIHGNSKPQQTKS